ncbi:hypothetical protein MRX96_019687 [Rhipicephalus microplus]
MYKGDGRRLLKDLKVKYLKTEKGQYPVPERCKGPDNGKLDRSVYHDGNVDSDRRKQQEKRTRQGRRNIQTAR